MRLAVEGTRRSTMLLISRTVLIVGCFFCDRRLSARCVCCRMCCVDRGLLGSRICGRGVRLWMSKLEGEVLKKCVCAGSASRCNSRLRRDRCPNDMRCRSVETPCPFLHNLDRTYLEPHHTVAYQNTSSRPALVTQSPNALDWTERITKKGIIQGYNSAH